MTAPTTVTPFDICGPLPEGTVLLEASAGTGKTFTIAALATRLVAEGRCELAELMLVTFSRAATQELRERVRERLLSAHARLGDPVAARRDDQDDLVRLLADAPDAEIAVRRRRLARALSSFDAATIATTHGFCQQMLAGLGVVGDMDADLTFVERVDDVVAEVVDDLYLRKFAPLDAPPPLIDHPTARKVAFQAVVADRHSQLEPRDADRGSPAQLRFGIATAVRDEVQARKRARRLIDYDDLLTRLRDALADPDTGPMARRRVRERYTYVLVDEFQDTDPVQWEVLRQAFLGHATLVLIGDPKQAIYAFRGADVLAYLAAADAATTHHTLAKNWRSDATLLRSFDAVFAGAALGDPRIAVRAVDAAYAGPRLSGAPETAPLRVRVVSRPEDVPQSKFAPVAEIRQYVADDVAADVVRLLQSGARLALDAAARPVAPGDVAVLVRTNDQADTVRAALVGAGVPAVLTGTRSVFLSPPAREWLVLLRALEQPHRQGLVRAAALTSFVGWDAERLATCRDEESTELGQRMRGWRDVLADRGVAALLEVISSSERLQERMLARVGGERDLTDLRHVGQALHEAAVTGQLGPAAVAEWLQRRLDEAAEDQADERSRRLETDADAVQVVTIHASKGLQFPIVYVPFAWDRHMPKAPDPLRLHDEGGRRVLDIGGSGDPGYDERKVRHLDEEAGEDLRLLYVALTRAQCQAVTWWAPSWNTSCSSLHRLLFAGRGLDGQPEASAKVPEDRKAREHLEQWAAHAGGVVAVQPASGTSGAPWSPAGAPLPDLSVASFDRRLDVQWRRTSYTALTRAAHDGAGDGGVASEPETEERQDEPAVPVAVEAAAGPDETALRALPSPMAELPSGTSFGTVVHSVLERVDTSAEDLAAELRRRCEEVLAGRLAPSFDTDGLAAALLPVLQTPLGPLASGLSLGEVARTDRLAELEFELPLAGGDEPRAAGATLAAITGLLRRHLPAGDPLVPYPDLLDTPALRGQALRGYLTGSIDAVLRVRDGEPRYLVVDYKTNWLGAYGPAGALQLTAWDYRPEVLATAMMHAHYPLQALLYSVALHRYLRWRQPSYDPAVHLGGVLYLFVRGMCGPGTPVVHGVPTGVFSWQPPADLVVELSGLLDRGAP